MRDLVTFADTELGQGIIVLKEGSFDVVVGDGIADVLANLHPGDRVEFVRLPGGEITTVASDIPVTNVESLIEGAELVAIQDIPVDASSWAFPLSFPSILARSLEDHDTAWIALEVLAGGYFEQGARSDHTKPWKRGLVAATVRGNWKELKALGVVSGESSWGWIRGRYYSPDSETSWKRVKGQFEGWMRAADVFLRNTEVRLWIAGLTFNEIISLPISRAIRCCGAITEGLFSHPVLGPGLQEALFDATITNIKMNHLISAARGQRDHIPERIMDEDTGEITYVVPATGEVLTEAEVGDFLPFDDEEVLYGEDDAPLPPTGVFWTFDVGRQAFCYWKDGASTVALVVQYNDREVQKFVDQIIGTLHVLADYDGSL